MRPIAFMQVRPAIHGATLSMGGPRIGHVRTPATVGAAPGHGQNPVRYLTVIDRIEEWRPVLDWEGFYEVSNMGRVRSVGRIGTRSDGREWRQQGRVLRLYIEPKQRYVRACLYRRNRRTTVLVHVLVLEAFAGPKPSQDFETRHLNGVRGDNRRENLCWGTRVENMRDKKRHGTERNLNKTHCPSGHRYSVENTYVNPRTAARHCRTCNAGYKQAFQARRRARAKAS